MNYPCETHGHQASSLNQMYHSVGLGGNDRHIFQGTTNDQWYIYYDDNCSGDGNHRSAWYVSNHAPNFNVPSNLQNQTSGCQNTMQIKENQTFPIDFGSHEVQIRKVYCNTKWITMDDSAREHVLIRFYKYSSTFYKIIIIGKQAKNRNETSML